MLPAAGQGIIGIQLLEKSKHREIFSSISDSDTFQCLIAERALLAEIGGSCRTPIGVNAYIKNSHIVLNAKLYSLDGAQIFSVSRTSSISEAKFLGHDAGVELNSIIPEELRKTWL